MSRTTIFAVAAIASIGAAAFSTSASASFIHRPTNFGGFNASSIAVNKAPLFNTHPAAFSIGLNKAPLFNTHPAAFSIGLNKAPLFNTQPFHAGDPDWCKVHGCGYRYGVGYGSAPVQPYATPVQTYVSPVSPAPAANQNCLSKTYQQDGSALFSDSCTGEQAATAPAQKGG
jgi:hypothetical protein